MTIGRPFYCRWNSGHFGIRIPTNGFGFIVKDFTRYPLLFRQRCSGIRFGKWWVGILKPVTYV